MSKKNKTVFVCNSCGFESQKWLGQCPSCKEWNTFVEETMLNNSIDIGINLGIANKNITPPHYFRN